MSKMNILIDFTNKLFEKYEKDSRISDMIYIDGGECTGTTTISKSVFGILNNTNKYILSREPSLINRKYVKEAINAGGFKDTAGLEILKIFVKDRAEHQDESVCMKKTIISDRGIFSTLIYQSGILDDDSTEKDIKDKCELIEIWSDYFYIKLPKLAINLISDNSDPSEDYVEFFRRLSVRRNSGEEMDEFDKITNYIKINTAYTELTNGLETNGRVIGLSFRDSIEDLSSSISDMIININ